MLPVKLFTVKQASQIIGCSTNTLYKYLDEGRLKASRGTADQGRFRIPQTALEEFLGTPLAADTIQTVVKNKTSLPLKLIRTLIVISLLLILFDIIMTGSAIFIKQLPRLLFLIIALLLAYQQGGYDRTA